jgi:hypothetical protein
MPEQLGRMMHTEETVVVSDSANLARVSMFHVCRWELPYDNNGLALVLLSGVLVRGGRNDLGQADRYSIVSWCIVRRSTLVVLRGRLILDIIRRLVEGRIGSAWSLSAPQNTHIHRRHLRARNLYRRTNSLM